MKQLDSSSCPAEVTTRSTPCQQLTVVAPKSVAPFHTSEKVNTKHMANLINHLNFKEGEIRLYFTHKKYGYSIFRTARPEPCDGEQFECRWSEDDTSKNLKLLSNFNFHSICFGDGLSLYKIKTPSLTINQDRIQCNLWQSTCHKYTRKYKRHNCSNIKTQIIQSGVVFTGSLIDFNAVSFRTRIRIVAPQTPGWLNSDEKVHVTLSSTSETIFAGECRIIRYELEQDNCDLVLKPVKTHIRRVRAKRHRSDRRKLRPSPNVSFLHPLTGQKTDLKIANISGSGFAVREDETNPVLLPGMIVPSLRITFADSIAFQCRSQVIYQQPDPHATSSRICGLMILDMAPDEHLRLLKFLHQVDNEDLYLSNSLDMDEFWDFFFEAGFIYPQKYAHFHANKKNISQTYENIYNNRIDIARHFIYQKYGRIFGHVSMLRFFSRTWLIHHHASRAVTLKAGLHVLEQVGNYINDSHYLHSMRMKYLLCYYRPNNRFPNMVFGGVAKRIRNPEICAVDSFAYLRCKDTGQDIEFGEEWELTSPEPSDFVEFEHFCRSQSALLMCDALDISSNTTPLNELMNKYHRKDLNRGRTVRVLKKRGILKALFVVDTADFGLNMSELTNCIKTFVLEPDTPASMLRDISALICRQLHHNEMPVLLYPFDYAETNQMPIEKTYNQWLLNLEYTDVYFDKMKRILRFNKKSK